MMATVILLVFAVIVLFAALFTLLDGPTIDYSSSRNRGFDKSILLSEIDELYQRQKELEDEPGKKWGEVAGFGGLVGFYLTGFGFFQRASLGELGEGWLRLAATLTILFVAPIYIGISVYAWTYRLRLKRLRKKIDEVNWKIEMLRDR